MRKLLCMAALFAATVGANAQSCDIEWPSVADGQAQGWAAHSWTDDSYVIPAGTTLMDNDYITVSAAVDTPVFGVWSTYEDTNPLYVYWGSSKGSDESGYYDDIYSVSNIAVDNHGIIAITAKQSGRMTASYSMGSNLRSFYVYQVATEDEQNNGVYGYYAMCSTTNAAGIHTSAFNVRAGYTYWIIASGTGNQLYGLTYTAPDAENGYTTTDLPADPYTVVTFPTEEEGLAAGYTAHSWGEGYVYPAGTVILDDDDITVTNMVDCGIFPPDWFHSTSTEDYYDSYMYFGSQLSNNYKDDIYSAEGIASENHGIVSLKAKKSGRVVLSYSMGTNNRTCYVYRVGTEEEQNSGVYGAYVLSNFTDAKGIHTPAFDVMEGYEYYIIGSGSGNQLYAIGFADTETQETTGIQGVTTSTTTDKAANGKIYTIDGRYVGTDKSSLDKGLYIQDGKKFIVK